MLFCVFVFPQQQQQPRFVLKSLVFLVSLKGSGGEGGRRESAGSANKQARKRGIIRKKKTICFFDGSKTILNRFFIVVPSPSALLRSKASEHGLSSLWWPFAHLFGLLFFRRRGGRIIIGKSEHLFLVHKNKED